MKQTIRLTENELKNIIKESIKVIVQEGKNTNNKRMYHKYCNSPYYDEPIGHDEILRGYDDKYDTNSDGMIRIPTGRAATKDEIAKHNDRILTRDYVNDIANRVGFPREVLKTLTKDELFTLRDICSKVIDRAQRWGLM